ncbi:hypothetical protein [Mycobacterium sp. AZCC_0083]|uniref:hypothetical protein n=1 Tax=Mycobacterium sp. AZCC_0083 TaxID=2735882 RepID=UPI0016142DD9|nr:hypothetical protein [Mycobacterium sp. AZCC_0083]MBB5161591.1 hypothetical protein [Mycobacterium sp. AZCC_0083]
MADASDSPSEGLNLDFTTISSLVGVMQRLQDEVDAASQQVVDALLISRPRFQELIDQAIRAAAYMSTRLRESLPINWPRDGRLNGVWAVLTEDGLPLVYVPRAEIVQAVLDAENYADRVRVLVGRRDDVIDDCRTAINATQLHPSVADLGDFVREALTLLAERRFAGAQSLAANLCDTIIRGTMPPRRPYSQMVKTIDESRLGDELLSVSLAFRPVLQFYVPWNPGDPPAARLRRHCTAHFVSPEQLTERNATIAVMLATSLLLAVSEWDSWAEGNEESI